jgi:hypothetical protein
MQHRKRKDPTPDEDRSIDNDNNNNTEMTSQDKSFVLTDEPAKKLAKTQATISVPFHSSSSSFGDDDDDEQKQPAAADVVMCVASPLPSFQSFYSSSSSGSPAQHEVFTKDQYVILILAFLPADQRIYISEVNRLFKRCSENGATSSPQVLYDEPRSPAVKVANLYKKCVALTLNLELQLYLDSDADTECEWRRQVLDALSLNYMHTLSFGTLSSTMPVDVQPRDQLIALSTKTPSLTALNTNTTIDPLVVRSFLEGPRAEKLQQVSLTLSSAKCASMFAECAPKLHGVRKLQLSCGFEERTTHMSTVLEATRSLPTLSEFVLKWHDGDLSDDHIDTLCLLLEKHHHTLTKTYVSSGGSLDADFSLWLIKWAGDSKSLVDFTANTFYDEACIRAATETVTRLSGQLQRFHICTDSYHYWLYRHRNHIGGYREYVPTQLLLDFFTACQSAPHITDCSIEDVFLPVRDLRNGCMSPTLRLPGGTRRMPLVEVARMYSVLLDGCPLIKQVIFEVGWQDEAEETELVNLMRHLPAVTDLCGNPRTHNLTQVPSALVLACVAHPTWTTVSYPYPANGSDGEVVHTKEELADHNRPLALLDEDRHGWTVCALALRRNPRIVIDTSSRVPDCYMLERVHAAVRKRVNANIIRTGRFNCHPEEMLHFVDGIAKTTMAEFNWAENGAPFPLLAIPETDAVVIRSSMRNTVDYLNTHHAMMDKAVSSVLLVYDSADESATAEHVFTFFSEWLSTIQHMRHFASCDLTVEGPASRLPPTGMYPFAIMIDSLCDGMASGMYVHGDQFKIVPLVHGDKWDVQFQAAGQFIRQFESDIQFNIEDSVCHTRCAETLDITVESLEELTGCLWCAGHAKITTFRMSSPGSSLEQFKETSDRFKNLLHSCITDQTSKCFNGVAVIKFDTDNRKLTCTITLAGQDGAAIRGYPIDHHYHHHDDMAAVNVIEEIANAAEEEDEYLDL